MEEGGDDGGDGGFGVGQVCVCMEHTFVTSTLSAGISLGCLEGKRGVSTCVVVSGGSKTVILMFS